MFSVAGDENLRRGDRRNFRVVAGLWDQRDTLFTQDIAIDRIITVPHPLWQQTLLKTYMLID